MEIKTTDEIGFAYPKNKKWVSVESLKEYLLKKDWIVWSCGRDIYDSDYIDENDSIKQIIKDLS